MQPLFKKGDLEKNFHIKLPFENTYFVENNW